MAKTLNLPFDEIGAVPVVGVNTVTGVTLAAPADAVAASDNPAVVATLANGVLTMSATARTGSANVTVTSGAMSDSVAVTITTPAATALDIEADLVTFSANPAVPAA